MLASYDIHRPLTGIRILLQSPHCAPLPHISLSSGEEQTGMTPVTLCVWKLCKHHSSSPTFLIRFLLSTVSRALDKGGIFSFGMMLLICVNPITVFVKKDLKNYLGCCYDIPPGILLPFLWRPYFCDTKLTLFCLFATLALGHQAVLIFCLGQLTQLSLAWSGQYYITKVYHLHVLSLANLNIQVQEGSKENSIQQGEKFCVHTYALSSNALCLLFDLIYLSHLFI